MILFFILFSLIVIVIFIGFIYGIKGVEETLFVLKETKQDTTFKGFFITLLLLSLLVIYFVAGTSLIYWIGSYLLHSL